MLHIQLPQQSLLRNFRQHLQLYIGLPEIIVSDNGTSFTSQEFQTFLRQNGIQHVRMSAYHPSSNGLAERYVQTVKQGLRKITSGSMESRVARLLSRYSDTSIDYREITS